MATSTEQPEYSMFAFLEVCRAVAEKDRKNEPEFEFTMEGLSAENADGFHIAIVDAVDRLEEFFQGGSTPLKPSIMQFTSFITLLNRHPMFAKWYKSDVSRSKDPMTSLYTPPELPGIEEFHKMRWTDVLVA